VPYGTLSLVSLVAWVMPRREIDLFLVGEGSGGGVVLKVKLFGR
jgi:hypothetical protein